MFHLVNGTVAGAVCVSLNVSLRYTITEDILLSIFKTGDVPEDWIFHMNIFYSEIPSDTIARFVKEYKIPRDLFIYIHNKLPSFCKYPKFDTLLKEVSYELGKIA